MIIIVGKEDEQVKAIAYNFSEVKLYIDCVYIDGEKQYGMGQDNIRIYRVDSLPRDYEQGEYYYNGRSFYKKSKLGINRGFRS